MADVLDLTADSPEKGATPPPARLARPAAAAAAATAPAVRLSLVDDDDEEEDDDFEALLTNEFEDVLGPEPPGGSERRARREEAMRMAMASTHDSHNSFEDNSGDSDDSGSSHTKQRPAARKKCGGGGGARAAAAAAPKPPKKSKEELAEARAEAKALRDAQKAMEKQKLAEKKAWEKLLAESLRGSHKYKEICVILDKRMHGKLAEKVLEELTAGDIAFKHLFLPGPGYDEGDEPLEENRYHRGYVGWMRMPRPTWDDEHLCPRPHGPYVEQLDFVAVVWEAADFCDQLGMDKRRNLQRGGPGGGGGGGCVNAQVGDPVFGHTYEALERTIHQMRRSPGVPTPARLVVVLQGVQGEIGKRWDRYNKWRSKGQGDENDICVTSDDYANALVWLLLSRGIEYKETKNEAETAQYIRETTRSLAEMPFRDISQDLSSVAKGKAVVNGAEGTTTQSLSEPDKIATAWARQLEAVTGMSDVSHVTGVWGGVGWVTRRIGDSL